jgi:C-terminal processing protease CtpA/Prc
MKYLIAATTFLFLLTACDSNNSKSLIVSKDAQTLRPLSQNERAADFDQLLELFKSYYGPYEYKEHRFGFSIEKMILDLKDLALNAKTDEEFMGYVMQVSASLKDGHVQFRVENSSSGIVRYKIPISLVSYENKVIVADVTPDFSKWNGIKLGDEIISVDGQSPKDILSMILKYRRSANDLTDQALVYFIFFRPSFMSDLIPKDPTSLIVFRTRDNKISSVTAPWTSESYVPTPEGLTKTKSVVDLSVPMAEDFNASVVGHRGQMGQVNPIFLTDSAMAQYRFIKVFPSTTTMKAVGLTGDEKPGIYAALYKHSGKTVLLLRSSTYAPSDYSPSVYMKTYMALLQEYQDLADVLVLDQTHNPGGSFCADFYNLFANNNDVQSVEQARADRKWVNDLSINWPKEEGPSGNPWDLKLLQTWGLIVERAYDQGLFLTEPFALFGGSPYAVKKDFTWTKPMLVLIDELAGSCGDLFPMLVKANKRAQLFGQRTMGLGGNVEEVGQLNHSRIVVRMTRGLFFPYRPDGKYMAADYVENNGVSPDIEYAHTVDDFRNGFINYIKLFSDAAVELAK